MLTIVFDQTFRFGSVVRQNQWFGEPNRIPNQKGEIQEKVAEIQSQQATTI